MHSDPGLNTVQESTFLPYLCWRECAGDEGDEGDALALEDLPAVLQRAHAAFPRADGGARSGLSAGK